jgi:5-methylcytosine-specific restriction endonuclease McrA
LGAPIKELRSSSAVPADWVKIREAVLRRDKYKCLECGKPCRSAEADVHHLLPRSAGGTDEPSNLVTLCDGCHAASVEKRIRYELLANKVFKLLLRSTGAVLCSERT